MKFGKLILLLGVLFIILAAALPLLEGPAYGGSKCGSIAKYRPASKVYPIVYLWKVKGGKWVKKGAHFGNGRYCTVGCVGSRCKDVSLSGYPTGGWVKFGYRAGEAKSPYMK